MEPFVTLIKVSGSSAQNGSGRPDPVTIAEQVTSQHQGSIQCALVTAGRYDLVIFSQFPSLSQCLAAWATTQVMYGWQTETLSGLPLPEGKKIYQEATKQVAGRH